MAALFFALPAGAQTITREVVIDRHFGTGDVLLLTHISLEISSILLSNRNAGCRYAPFASVRSVSELTDPAVVGGRFYTRDR